MDGTSWLSQRYVENPQSYVSIIALSFLAVVPQPQLSDLNWLPSTQSEGDCIHECRDAYPVVEIHKRLDGVAQNNAGEFGCISTRSTVTGTKGEEYSSCVGVCFLVPNSVLYRRDKLHC